MKKTVLILALLLLIGSGLLFFGAEGRVQAVAFDSIPLSENASDPSAGDSVSEDGSLLLSVAYEGMTLPVNDDGTVLLPLIPESGLTVTCEKGVSLIRTGSAVTHASGTLRSVALTVRKGNRSRTLTLRETGMGVAYLNIRVPGITNDSDPILDKKREGTLRLLSIDENGALRFESADVSVKRRGASSRNYKKKSITVTNRDASNDPVARPLMGLPADTKFGLNSMYEDDVKIRDMLSLGLWADMQPEGTPCIRMRYCELYVDGVYWGLYGFQQVVSANSLGLAPEDGLAKIFSDTGPVLKERRLRAVDTVQELPDGSVAYLLLDGLASLAEKAPDALLRFNRESLYRYALFLQFICGTDSALKNVVGICRADTGLLSLTAYDTDQSFGLMWDNACPPLYMGVHPELAQKNFLSGSYSTWSGLVSDGVGAGKELAELWFELRKGPFDENALLEKARALFTLVTESGARARERRRWPGGNACDTPAQIESFITERIAFCDAYFKEFLEEDRNPAG